MPNLPRVGYVLPGPGRRHRLVIEDTAHPKTVLIVDDDPQVRRVVNTLCAMDGYTVVGEAANGIDAEILARTHHPHFVVLDYMMPFQDGARCARVLRQVVPQAKIVAFSAVILTKPDWADAFCPKSDVDSITEVLNRLFYSSAA